MWHYIRTLFSVVSLAQVDQCLAVYVAAPGDDVDHGRTHRLSDPRPRRVVIPRKTTGILVRILLVWILLVRVLLVLIIHSLRSETIPDTCIL